MYFTIDEYRVLAIVLWCGGLLYYLYWAATKPKHSGENIEDIEYIDEGEKYDPYFYYFLGYKMHDWFDHD